MSQLHWELSISLLLYYPFMLTWKSPALCLLHVWAMTGAADETGEDLYHVALAGVSWQQVPRWSLKRAGEGQPI